MRNDPERSEGGVKETPLQDVLVALRAHLGDSLRSVVLFGSRARGDARPESDWDLFVIAGGLPSSPLERSRMLRRVVPPRWCGRAAIIATTPQEFEAQFPAYYLDIAADGRILYDADGYVEDRLNRIHQRVREAGLHRRRLAHGFVWTWETPPRGSWRIDWDGVHGLGIRRWVPAAAGPGLSRRGRRRPSVVTLALLRGQCSTRGGERGEIGHRSLRPGAVKPRRERRPERVPPAGAGELFQEADGERAIEIARRAVDLAGGGR